MFQITQTEFHIKLWIIFELGDLNIDIFINKIVSCILHLTVKYLEIFSVNQIC